MSSTGQHDEYPDTPVQEVIREIVKKAFAGIVRASYTPKERALLADL